jgi:hypothetical protein
MNRSVNNFLNQEQSNSANYAAQTALNDTLGYIKKHLNDVQPVSSPECETLFGSGMLDPNIVDDGSVKYTCVLVNPIPDSLVYQRVSPNRAQVVKLTTCLGSPCVASRADKLMFSWQSSDRTKNNFPLLNINRINETEWNSNNYTPMLRLTLYPIPNSGDLSGTQSQSRTFFLVPGPSSQSIFTSYSFSGDGNIITVPCDRDNHYRPIGGFNGTVDYDCAIIIEGLFNLIGGNLHHFYAVLTPIYGQADIKIKATGPFGLSALNFQNVQSLIDVTGTSNGLSRRLQARANISKGASIDPIDNAIPDVALRSAKTICKRLKIENGVTVDGTACDLDISPPPNGSGN